MSKPKRYAHNSTLPAASKPMARFNAEKRARRMSENRVYGSHHQRIKQELCVEYGNPLHDGCEFYNDRPSKGIEPHHLVSVGAGGEDRNNEVPCCHKLHDEFHRLGLTEMCERYRKDYRSIACEYTAMIDAEDAARGPSVETGEQTE